MVRQKVVALSPAELANDPNRLRRPLPETEVVTGPPGTTIFVYDIDAIPDPNEHQLAAQCRGDVRQSVFAGFEHLLRMITRFQKAEIALALRFLFSPDGNGGRQRRLRLQVALKAGAGIRQEIARQLIDVGPICEFFKLGTPRHATSATARALAGHATTQLELQRFPCACEIIRREDRVETQLPRELNKYVPTSGFYYSPIPLLPREDNDYLALDTLLSRLEEPCSVELLATPVDHTADLQAHDKYLRQLRAINGYGDDVYLGTAQENQATAFLGEESFGGAALLRDTRKKDPVADDILNEQQDYHRQLRQPQLLFNARVFAMQPETALMIASVVAECGFVEGKYRLLAADAGDAAGNGAPLEASLRATRRMEIALEPQYHRVWAPGLPEAWNGFRRLSRMASVDELKGLFRLPVAGSRSPRCIRRLTDPDANGGHLLTTILIGDDLESETPPEREFDLSDLTNTFDHQSASSSELRLSQKILTKHLFVAGVPGSGKTTAVFNILVQIHRQGIPFLVIEPAKSEYRTLKMLKDHPDAAIRRMAGDIQILTPGNEEVSPFRFNPLDFPDGITLDEHIGQLLACFDAAMPMGGPLQALIAEALEAVYADHAENRRPQMADLVSSARHIMAAKDYEGETRSNLQAAIEVRLGLLTRRAIGRLFGASCSIPSLAEILAHPTVIEMDYLPQDHACLLTLFLLTAVREQIRIDPDRRKPGLHHVTVIEEAHNIVGRTGAARGSEEIADPKAFAAEYVSRMLAELRALGEGIVIADQLPSTVAPQVVKNTGTKLAHRLVSNDDREELGGAMLMGATETEELARLSPGTAYLYTEGLYRPRRVRCLNSAAYLGLPERVVPVGKTIVPDLESDAWFTTAREQRALACLDRLEECQQRLAETLEITAKDIQPPGYEQRLEEIDGGDADRRSESLSGLSALIADDIEELRKQFEAACGRAVTVEAPFLETAATMSDQVASRYQALTRRKELELEPRFREIVETLQQIQKRMELMGLSKENKK